MKYNTQVQKEEKKRNVYLMAIESEKKMKKKKHFTHTAHCTFMDRPQPQHNRQKSKHLDDISEPGFVSLSFHVLLIDSLIQSVLLLLQPQIYRHILYGRGHHDKYKVCVWVSGAVFSHAWTCLLNLVPYENRKKNLSLSLSVYLIAKRTNMYILLCVRIFFFSVFSCLFLILFHHLSVLAFPTLFYLSLLRLFSVHLQNAPDSRNTRETHTQPNQHMWALHRPLTRWITYTQHTHTYTVYACGFSAHLWNA